MTIPPEPAMHPDYLSELLSTYWFAPPVALWRAVELRAASEERFERQLLDLGCGDGLVARTLFGRNRDVEVGVDPWMFQLSQARRAGTYRQLACASGERLPYASGSFKTVFSNSVLEHIPEPAPVLQEVERVLCEGGRFIFTVPSDRFRVYLDGYARRAEAGDQTGAEAYAERIDARLMHYHYHTPDEWRRMLHAIGMVVERTRYYMPEEVVRHWDRMNRWFGITGQRAGRRPRSVTGFLWAILASPRLSGSAHQQLLRRWTVRRFSRTWRCFYTMDVADGDEGGGLLVVAQKIGGA